MLIFYTELYAKLYPKSHQLTNTQKVSDAHLSYSSYTLAMALYMFIVVY